MRGRWHAVKAACRRGQTLPILPTFQLKPNIQLHRRGGPMCPPGKYRQHFLYSCRGVHCTPADRKRIFPKINRYDRTARLMRADTRVIPLSGEMSRSDKRVAVVLRSPLQCESRINILIITRHKRKRCPLSQLTLTAPL